MCEGDRVYRSTSPVVKEVFLGPQWDFWANVADWSHSQLWRSDEATA